MTCPICGKAARPGCRPFCSRRCADVDLGNWLTGRYAVGTDEAPDPDEAGPNGPADRH